MNKSPLLALATSVVIASSALAQSLSVPLNYNWNGIVHAGEANNPDSLTGYRSISDRGLDFSLGVPADPLLAPYQFIMAADTLDCVHLGNRNTVDGGNKMFDPTPDGDNLGVQPAWLPNVDQTGPQTTVLGTPLPIGPTTTVSFLYQISNGGGAFDVTFTFQGGATTTASLSGGDWFGGPLPGTANVDTGSLGTAQSNLSVTEGNLNLGAFNGQLVTEITFGNQSNTNAGYAILACNFNYPVQPPRVNQIPLNYNWNGIVHAGEAGNPDSLTGYRSISDRGLDFTAGVPNDPMLAPYTFVTAADTLDIVHLGNRNTVDGGSKVFDLTPDGDDFGVQPSWLPNVDQTGPQTTTLTDKILLDNTSEAKLLFQISNGGGSFDIQFGFQSGAPVVATVSGGDWYGGSLAGTAFTDSGLTDWSLSLTERTIDLTAQAGRVLTSITFQNSTNPNAGIAIVAMNVAGCVYCVNGSLHNIVNLGGGTGATMATSSTGGLGCPLNWTVANAAPNAIGLFMLSPGSTSVPLSVVLPGCGGVIHTPSPLFLTAITDPFGSASIQLQVPADQSLCGADITGQHVAIATGACWLVLSDAIDITIGN